MRKLIVIFRIAFLLLNCNGAISQTAFHINTSREFNTDMITEILRDSKKNMWIASYNGLYKHEGSRIRNFLQQSPSGNALSGLEIHCLMEDHEGYVWVGTTNGVDRIDPLTYTIKHVPLKSNDSASSFLGYITAIFQDDEQRVWICTEGALFRVDPETFGYEVIPKVKGSNGIPSTIMTKKAGEKSGDGIWMMTAEGLVFYHYRTRQFHHRYFNPDDRPIFKLASASWGSPGDLIRDQKGNLWFVFQDSKLIRFNPENNQVDSFPFQLPVNAWKCCYSLLEDHHQNIWLGFRHGGILHFDTRLYQFTPIRYTAGTGIIASNYVYGMAQDYIGNIWVSTDNGIDVINYYNKALRQVQLSQEADYTRLVHQSADMSRDMEDNIYIPFYRTGFFRYSYRNNAISFHKAGNGVTTGTSFIIPDAENKNRVWAARENGLIPVSLSDPAAQLRLSYSKIPAAAYSTPGDIIWEYSEDPHSVYVRKNNGMLYHLRPEKTDSLRAYYWRKNLTLSEDKKYLWYITRELNLARRNLNTWVQDTFDIQRKLKSLNFSFSNPRAVLEDGNSIWITSQNGLLRFFFRQDSLATYSTQNGLAHSFSFALHKDIKNRVWVSSFGGIDYYDRQSNAFKTLMKFPTTSYMETFGSIIELSDHHLVFHAGNHLYIVNPEFVEQLVPEELVLALDEFLINGEAVHWTDPDMLSALDHTQNHIQARFGLIAFDKKMTIQYWYRLHSGDQWVNNGNNSELLFNTLKPGTYALQIKATDISGRQLSEVLHVNFRIAPPFWKTWWFISLVAGIMLIIVYLLYKNRINTLERKAKLEKQIAELESKALRAQMNPHFIFNSLNAIQELVVTEKLEDAYSYLSRFSRLLRMVLNHSEKSIISLADELNMLQLYLQLESLRFKSNFEYRLEVEETVDPEMSGIPPLLVQPYIENAIWHGLSAKEGKRILEVTFREDNNNLICRIKDNGIGRKKAGEIKASKLSSNKFESKGMKLNEHRMRLLNLQQNQHLAVQVNDLADAAGNAIGTEVILTIPQTDP